MLPTIDFSLLGLLAAVWAGLKIIWDITCKFFKWVSDKALTLLIGSKFWATAAFFAASVAIMSLMSYVVNAFLSFLVQTAVGSISFAPLRESMLFLGNFLPLAELGSVLTFFVSAWSLSLVAENYGYWWAKMRTYLRDIKSSWKT